MRRRVTSGGRALRAGPVVLAIALLGGCTPATPVAEPVAVTTSPSTGAVPAIGTRVDDTPLGLAAIGHSGLTGYAIEDADAAARTHSWATGTDAAVDSVYQRLVAVDPAAEDHVVNTAAPGTGARSLLPEALRALAVVGHPQLVVVQDVGNDVGCDGSAAATAAVVREQVSSTLDTLFVASPRSRVLVLGQLGTVTGRAAALADDPAATAHSSGDGACDLFDASGAPQPDRVAALAATTAEHERAFADACAAHPGCVYSGVLAQYPYRVSELVPGDWDHLTAAGQAEVAALVWPEVERLLDLPAPTASPG